MPEQAYELLGFKTPEFISNHFGIKIYIGTKGKEDWCIEVTRELCKLKCPKYPFAYNYAEYMISEEKALQIAREITAFADCCLKNYESEDK